MSSRADRTPKQHVAPLKGEQWVVMATDDRSLDNFHTLICMGYCFDEHKYMHWRGVEICYVPAINTVLYVPAINTVPYDGVHRCGDYVLCPTCYHLLVEE